MIDQGIRLTLVGMGVAFALLLLLTVVVFIMGTVAERIPRILNRSAGNMETENRLDYDKALAAVIGVGIMRAKKRSTASATDDA